MFEPEGMSNKNQLGDIFIDNGLSQGPSAYSSKEDEERILMGAEDALNQYKDVMSLTEFFAEDIDVEKTKPLIDLNDEVFERMPILPLKQLELLEDTTQNVPSRSPTRAKPWQTAANKVALEIYNINMMIFAELCELILSNRSNQMQLSSTDLINSHIFPIVNWYKEGEERAQIIAKDSKGVEDIDVEKTNDDVSERMLILPLEKLMDNFAKLCEVTINSNRSNQKQSLMDVVSTMQHASNNFVVPGLKYIYPEGVVVTVRHNPDTLNCEVIVFVCGSETTKYGNVYFNLNPLGLNREHVRYALLTSALYPLIKMIVKRESKGMNVHLTLMGHSQGDTIAHLLTKKFEADQAELRVNQISLLTTASTPPSINKNTFDDFFGLRHLKPTGAVRSPEDPSDPRDPQDPKDLQDPHDPQDPAPVAVSAPLWLPIGSPLPGPKTTIPPSTGEVGKSSSVDCKFRNAAFYPCFGVPFLCLGVCGFVFRKRLSKYAAKWRATATKRR